MHVSKTNMKLHFRHRFFSQRESYCDRWRFIETSFQRLFVNLAKKELIVSLYINLGEKFFSRLHQFQFDEHVISH